MLLNLILIFNRWNSTYDMISRYLELHPYLLTAFGETHHNLMIEGEDIELCNQLSLCLKLFKKLVTLVSSIVSIPMQKYLTVQ